MKSQKTAIYSDLAHVGRKPGPSCAPERTPDQAANKSAYFSACVKQTAYELSRTPPPNLRLVSDRVQGTSAVRKQRKNFYSDKHGTSRQENHLLCVADQ